MRKMKDSGFNWIGEIPEEWTLARYKFFSENGMGQTILKEDLDENGVPVYSATQSNDIFGFISSPNVLLNKGDFVIPARGNSIGCVTMIEDELATCTQTTIYSKVFGINKRFLYYCCWGLKSEWFKFDQTAIPQITVNQVKNNIVPLPSDVNQQKISTYLDQKVALIDNIIEKTKESIEEYKNYKQSLITETVTKGLNPDVKMKDSGIEWIGEIPEHWAIMKIKYLLNSATNKNVYDSNYIGLENVEKESGRYVDVSEKTTLGGDTLSYEPDSILFGKLRPYLAKVYKTQTRGCCSSEFLVLGVIDGDIDFYFYRLLSGEFIRIVNSSTYGTKMPRASWDFIKELRIPVPPMDEQREIKEFLSIKSESINEFIDCKMKLISELEMYKKSLIYEVVTGKKGIN